VKLLPQEAGQAGDTANGTQRRLGVPDGADQRPQPGHRRKRRIDRLEQCPHPLDVAGDGLGGQTPSGQAFRLRPVERTGPGQGRQSRTGLGVVLPEDVQPGPGPLPQGALQRRVPRFEPSGADDGPQASEGGPRRRVEELAGAEAVAGGDGQERLGVAAPASPRFEQPGLDAAVEDEERLRFGQPDGPRRQVGHDLGGGDGIGAGDEPEGLGHRRAAERVGSEEEGVPLAAEQPEGHEVPDDQRTQRAPLGGRRTDPGEGEGLGDELAQEALPDQLALRSDVAVAGVEPGQERIGQRDERPVERQARQRGEIGQADSFAVHHGPPEVGSLEQLPGASTASACGTGPGCGPVPAG
jgi:hypothetical protein